MYRCISVWVLRSEKFVGEALQMVRELAAPFVLCFMMDARTMRM